MKTNFKNKYSDFQFGFTMLELVVTLAIFSFGIIGVYAVFAPAVKLNYTLTANFTASQLAQEGVEIVNNILDRNASLIKQGQNTTWLGKLEQCNLGCQVDYKTETPAQTFQHTLKPYSEQEYLSINDNGFYGYEQGINTKFKRKIIVVQGENPDVAKIEVVVYWDYNGVPFQVQTEVYRYHLK